LQSFVPWKTVYNVGLPGNTGGEIMPSLCSRRNFVQAAGAIAGGSLLFQTAGCKSGPAPALKESTADYTLTIAVTPVEIAPNHIVSTTTYNGQFPGPLLRLQEGKAVTIQIHNETDTPEQLHWHGQFVAVDVDGSAEEGTPFIPARGSRRITFTPKPGGFRFYHTHVRAGANLSAGQYTGLVGPVYIEARNNPGRYDREVFLTLKEFEPTLSRGGDMDMDFLSPSGKVSSLKEAGESAMQASLAKGSPHGFEVGYGSFTINGHMLGSGEPVRVKQGERVLFHVLNGSATEIRSLALPGHTFTVVAMDGNPIPKPVNAPGLWLGTGERVSAIVEMNHPGVWILGDTADDDREHGMGVVVEYAGRNGKPVWVAQPKFSWNYAQFGNSAAPAAPDETFDLAFAKENAASNGFNRWSINGVAFDENHMHPMFRIRQGKRYRLRMRNSSDDIHPIHLHRHSFELTRVAGQPTSGLIKDVAMVGGYQEMEVDFVASNPGLTLFHCHQQLHMDFGFMALFEYV
jgi:FtsP/CotA-like multicopper oxidase with cupredoxin domain